MDDKQAILACELLRKQLTNVIEYISNAPQAEFDRNNILALAENSLRIINNYNRIEDEGNHN